MRLLLDHGLPRRAAADLRALGWDVIHATESAPSINADPEILDAGRRDSRAIVTLDHDFARLLALTEATAPSVICLRIQRLNRARAVALLVALRPVVEAHVASGAIVSVDAQGVRVRALPLKGAQPRL